MSKLLLALCVLAACASSAAAASEAPSPALQLQPAVERPAAGGVAAVGGLSALMAPRAGGGRDAQGLSALMQDPGGAALRLEQTETHESPAAAASAALAPAPVALGQAADSTAPPSDPASAELPKDLERRFAELETAFDEKKLVELLDAVGPRAGPAAEMAARARALSLPVSDGMAGEIAQRLGQQLAEAPHAATPAVERSLHARIDALVEQLKSRYNGLKAEHYVPSRQGFLPRVSVRASFWLYEKLGRSRPDLVVGRLDESLFRLKVDAGAGGAELDDLPGVEVSLWTLESLGRLSGALATAQALGPGKGLDTLNTYRREVDAQKTSHLGAGFGALVFAVMAGLFGGAMGMLASLPFPLELFLRFILTGAALGSVATLGFLGAKLARSAASLIPRLRSAKTTARGLLLDRFVETARQGPLIRALMQVASCDPATGVWEPLKGYEPEFKRLCESWPEFREAVLPGTAPYAMPGMATRPPAKP